LPIGDIKTQNHRAEVHKTNLKNKCQLLRQSYSTQ